MPSCPCCGGPVGRPGLLASPTFLNIKPLGFLAAWHQPTSCVAPLRTLGMKSHPLAIKNLAGLRVGQVLSMGKPCRLPASARQSTPACAGLLVIRSPSKRWRLPPPSLHHSQRDPKGFLIATNLPRLQSLRKLRYFFPLSLHLHHEPCKEQVEALPVLWGGSAWWHSHLLKPWVAQTVLRMIPGTTENCIFSLREVKARNVEKGEKKYHATASSQHRVV